MPNKYANKYNAEHYKRFQMSVTPEVNEKIRQTLEANGFSSMKDFFYTMFLHEYGINLDRIPEDK